MPTRSQDCLQWQATEDSAATPTFLSSLLTVDNRAELNCQGQLLLKSSKVLVVLLTLALCQALFLSDETLQDVCEAFKGTPFALFLQCPPVFNYFDEGIAHFNTFSFLVMVVCSLVTNCTAWKTLCTVF